MLTQECLSEYLGKYDNQFNYCNFYIILFQISSIPGMENVTAASSSTGTSSQAAPADSTAPPAPAAPGAPPPPPVSCT